MSSVCAEEINTDDATIDSIDNEQIEEISVYNDENLLEESDEIKFESNQLESNGEDTLIGANNFVVDEKTFSGIQTVVNEARLGDTITLDGTYSSNGNNTINITKQLNFIGINNATLDASGFCNIFKISVNGVSFKNINFINGNASRGGAIYGAFLTLPIGLPGIPCRL